jgi:hypothetical protein
MPISHNTIHNTDRFCASVICWLYMHVADHCCWGKFKLCTLDTSRTSFHITFGGSQVSTGQLLLLVAAGIQQIWAGQLSCDA